MLSIIAQAPPPDQRQPVHGAVDGQLTQFVSISLAFGFCKIGYAGNDDQPINRAIDRLLVVIGCIIVLSLVGPLVTMLLPG